VRELGPAIDTFGTVAPVALADMHMDPPEPVPYLSTTALLDDLPPAALDELLAAAGPGSGSPLLSVELRHTGGALARPAPGAGARATLPGQFAMYAVGLAADEQAGGPLRTSLDAVDGALAPYKAGDYPNFVERPTDAERLFDADSWARLREVKALYDPRDIFRGNHHVPPPP
jgi:hypothetical protein